MVTISLTIVDKFNSKSIYTKHFLFNQTTLTAYKNAIYMNENRYFK